MTPEEIVAWGVGLVLGLPTLVQLTPIKINPWSIAWKGLKWVWRGFCRSLNSAVLEELDTVKTDLGTVTSELRDTKLKLENHIKMDDEREADKVRASILHFNNELLRDIPHTQEEFVEILKKIDWYNDFCRSHEDYKNSRAVHAIANIERVYDDRLRLHDFL